MRVTTQSQKGAINITTRPFVEYRDVTTTDELHQGDILEAVDETTLMWKRHLFVITADCDLAHRKNQGRITCIPLLTAAEYHREMLLPRLRDRFSKKPLTEISRILELIGGPQISPDRLSEWIQEENAEDIITDLHVTSQVDDIRQAIRSLQLIYAPANDLGQAIQNLVESQLLNGNPPSRRNAIKNVIEPLKSAYSSPPGDALFLSAFSPGHEFGYFAYFRHLEQVWETDVATGPAHRQVSYRRIARLKDRFIHALVQRFALVFMPIGLPTDYEEMCALHADSMGDLIR